MIDYEQDYKIYLKKYAEGRGISEEEASEHLVVKFYREMVGDRTTDAQGRSLEKSEVIVETVECGSC